MGTEKLMISPTHNTIHIFHYLLSRCFMGMVLKRLTRMGWAKLIAVKKRFQCYLSSGDYVIKGCTFSVCVSSATTCTFPLHPQLVKVLKHFVLKKMDRNGAKSRMNDTRHSTTDAHCSKIRLYACRLQFPAYVSRRYQRPFWSDNSHGWIAYTTVGKHHFFASLSIALD